MACIKKRLKNGMTVIFEKREQPVVCVSVTNRFGASHEESKIKGIAHFIEHLVFTGTKTRSHEDISREIEKKGGILNAFTAHDVTSFWFKLPSEHLFAGMDILADILKNPKFDLEKFEREKKVILEEIKMRHDAPQWDVFDKIHANLYSKPFGEPIIGSKETVSALSRDFVVEHFKKVYNPKNFIVSIVGDADFEKVCKYLEETFSQQKEESKFIEIKKKNAETTEERAGIDQAHFILAMHAPLKGSPEYSVLEVLDAYLANGMSSRLFLEIREKRGLAYTVMSALEAEKNYSYYAIYVGTTKEALPEVKKIILEELKNIKNMAEKDLSEAKERMIGLRKVTSDEITSIMTNLMFSELATRAEDYYEYEKNIRKVTLEQVKKLAQNISKEFSTAAIVPK